MASSNQKRPEPAYDESSHILRAKPAQGGGAGVSTVSSVQRGYGSIDEGKTDPLTTITSTDHRPPGTQQRRSPKLLR